MVSVTFVVYILELVLFVNCFPQGCIYRAYVSMARRPYMPNK